MIPGQAGPGLQEASEGFLAAMLAAGKSECSCETCQIMRTISERLTAKFRK